jgi:UDPglucose--hexose-1-phosphate uridylyltransferase
VVCFTDQHEGSFGTLSLSQMRIVLEAWRDRVKELSKSKFVEHIYLFENRGEEVGVTLNHPHGQIYAYSFIPPRTEKMLKAATEYLKKNGTPLITDIIARELKDEVRIVATNAHWIAYVPFASRYPFEIHIAPRKFVSDLPHLSEEVADSFPEIAKEVFLRLDGVFGIEMAYIASWHQAPVRVGRDALGLHLQITSVRRAPGKLKYLSGSESAMGAFVMDMRPEQSAQQLREVKL